MPRPIDRHAARFRPHACPPSCIVVPFDGLVSERFRASRSDVGKLRGLRCSVRLMPRPIDRHAARFRPHACPPSCIVVPHDGLDSGQFRTNRSDIGKLRALRCNVRLMPRPIDRHVARFLAPAHALRPDCSSHSRRVFTPFLDRNRQLPGNPRPSLDAQRDFVPTHAFRPGAAGGSPAGVSPEQHHRRTGNLPGPACADPQGSEVCRDASHP
ncbi:Hypothetical predicted protein [Olea europaea subsp. europaea]|jgi:hypothetical protein|uniref:Uncharacterized protein n=1 Tax=Olea europaea subsp. europaea TaxID=158383 RepID=A0A8S0SKC4_OLEEU|nr:Hypothetical predicted protein [Olea europaea subsp. europaea]